MKKFLFTVIPLLFAATVFAQADVTITEETAVMSKGSQNSFSLMIAGADLKTIEKDWTKYMGQGTKEKQLKVEDEIVQPKAVNTNVSPDPFNIYSKLLATTEGVKLTAWFTSNDTLFMSSAGNENQVLAIKKYLTDFWRTERKDVIQKELDEENKKLKSLEKELDNLVKDEENAYKKINNEERSIDKAKSDMITNQADQKTKATYIQEQKEMVVKTESAHGDTHKAAQKALKDLENDKRKLERDYDKAQKDIAKSEAEIRNQQRSINDMKSQQAAKRVEIEKQKEVVKVVEAKLSALN